MIQEKLALEEIILNCSIAHPTLKTHLNFTLLDTQGVLVGYLMSVVFAYAFIDYTGYIHKVATSSDTIYSFIYTTALLSSRIRDCGLIVYNSAALRAVLAVS